MCADVPSPKVHPVSVSQKQALDPAFCLQCHADKNAKYVHSVIAQKTCNSCHLFSTDGSETKVKLIASGRELCLQCHADKDAEHANGDIHAPVKEGCTSCHDAHASQHDNLLVKPSAGAKENSVCTSCHQEGLAAPAGGSRHAALDMGCESCHITHKSGDPKKKEFQFRLITAAPALCRNCHTDSDPKLRKAHKDQPTANSDCTRCHDPHRSTVAKLLHPNGHDPYAKNQCEKCHAAAKDDKVVLAEGGQRALCYNCHDKKKAQVEQSSTKHPVPYLTETCTDCHDPHASRYPSLLRQSEANTCATCHEKSALPVQHGPYMRGQCTSCHDPHGANEPKLLRASENNICRSCHVLGQSGVKVKDDKVQLPWNAVIAKADYDLAPKLGLDANGDTGHPVVGHPISGPNIHAADKAPLGCSSCHQGHSSKTSGLLPASATDSIQLCEQCHKG